MSAHRLGVCMAKSLLLCLLIPTALMAQNWMQQSPATSPPARGGSAMVYDSLRHQTVLFGGQNASSVALNDTWVYDGTTWKLLSPVTSPPARLWHTMAFDAATGNTVLFGGCTSNTCATYLGDTWLWNGTNWSLAEPEASPSPRQAPAMAYDPDNSGVVLFGGSNSPGSALADTWVWDGFGSTWNAFETAPVPGRVFSAASYDAVNKEVVMFGGSTGSTALSDTWLWGGSNWSQASPANSPEAEDTHGQIYDPVRQLTVLHGGGGESDTWLWNGSTWSQENTSNVPPARSYVNMVYDIQHGEAVLFGGTPASGVLNDTWPLGFTYSPGWVQYTGAPAASGFGPAARQNPSMATQGSTVVLFGGATGSTVFNDTWIWTGDFYQESSTSNPPGRHSSPMALDSNGNLVLFGGSSSTVGTAIAPLSDTWLFNGFGWFTTSATGPSARAGHSMAYDPIH